MTSQSYLIVNQATNVVDNVVMWDGNTNNWQPPANTIALVQATTPAIVWEFNLKTKDWELVEKMGAGAIHYIWNGSVLTTNESKPDQ